MPQKTEKKERKRSELLSSVQIRDRVLVWLQLVLFLLMAAAFILVLIVNPEGSYRRFVYGGLISGLMVLIVLAFLLQRFRFYYASVGLTVACTVIGPWGSLILDPAVIAGDFFPLVYVSVSILISSIFLPFLATVVITGVQYAALIAVVALNPASQFINWPSFLAFVFIIAVLSIITNFMNRKDLAHIEVQKKQLQQAAEELQEQTIRDHLTGLFNRRYFEMTLDHEIQRAEQKQISIGIIMIDIDRFKNFNDAFGHASGDALLQEIGIFLSDQVSITNFVCRYGGDEFVIVIPGADKEMMEAIAEQCRKNLAHLQIVQDKQFGRKMVTLSLGMALFPDHGRTREEVVVSADEALYKAKQEGRNRSVVAK